MKQGRSVRLRQERELRGWSRSYIAEQVEADLGTVGRWERGERLPHPHYRQKLCDLFGKSAQELGLLPERMDELEEDADALDLPPHPSSTPEQETAPGAREASTSKTLSSMNRQNRQRMLDKMYSFWVKGVLEQSLYGGELVALSFTEQPDAVADPWALTFQQPQVESGRLSTDLHLSQISQVYDEVDGELLILGEPGSGKTTLLLELTRLLLERANREESHPLPVVFNLTSWAVKRRSLGDWLVEELCIKYQVPRQLAQMWVRTEQILPLLDGLDEVAATARSGCVEAINAYRREHGLLPMVVCCRLADYFAQGTRLLLRCGIVVQPLTAQQIEAYLSGGGERFAALHQALQEDPALQELASSPLMLSILAQTYQNRATNTSTEAASPSGIGERVEIPLAGSFAASRDGDVKTLPGRVFTPLEVRRREVLATYIGRMLTHRKSPSRYTAKQTQHWLTWLARQLAQQQQTEFYIERMQPDWLPSPQAFRLYSCLLVGLLIGVLGGITAMFADIPVYELVRMQIFALFSRSGMTAVQCANPLLIFETPVATVASIFSPLIAGLLYGAMFGVFGALLTWKGPRFQFTGAHTRLSNFQRHGLTFLLGLACGSIFILINLLWVPCPLSHGGASYNQIIGELSYGAAGVFVGGLLGLLTGDLFGAGKAQIQPVEALVWTRVPLRRRVIASLLGGALGALVGGGMELASEVYLKFSSWQTYLPISALIGGLLGLAIGGGFGGFSRHTLEKGSLVKPNEGIRRSLRNGLLIGLPIGLALSGFTLGLALWLIPDNIADGLLLCIPLGLIVALILFLLNGGYAWLQHVILRFILYRQGVIPWNYTGFLDEAADRLLLRKVGGGYIFIHRLLLDYFASMS